MWFFFCCLFLLESTITTLGIRLYISVVVRDIPTWYSYAVETCGCLYFFKIDTYSAIKSLFLLIAENINFPKESNSVCSGVKLSHSDTMVLTFSLRWTEVWGMCWRGRASLWRGMCPRQDPLFTPPSFQVLACRHWITTGIYGSFLVFCLNSEWCTLGKCPLILSGSHLLVHSLPHSLLHPSLDVSSFQMFCSAMRGPQHTLGDHGLLTSFYLACEWRMMLIFLNDWKESQGKDDLWYVKWYRIQISLSTKYDWNITICYMSSSVTFLFQGQSWGVTETMEPAMFKLSALWPFAEKACQPLVCGVGWDHAQCVCLRLLTQTLQLCPQCPAGWQQWGLMKGSFGSWGSTLGTEATSLCCVLLLCDVCVFRRWPSWDVRCEQEVRVPHLPLSSSSLSVSLSKFQSFTSA